MTATLAPPPPLAELVPHTRRLLAPLGVHDLPLPSDLAAARSANDSTRLEAAHWRIGPADNALGECRIVRIQGKSSLIVNTLLFPRRPDRLPLFVAEVLIFGGVPRVAFFDLQTPGLASAHLGPVTRAARELSQAASLLPSGGEAPEWAVKYSTGHAVFTRPNDAVHQEALARLYGEFLESWRHLAEETPPSADAAPPAAVSAVQSWKTGHAEEAPVRDYLGRVFGAAWADRFLVEFLYR